MNDAMKSWRPSTAKYKETLKKLMVSFSEVRSRLYLSTVSYITNNPMQILEPKEILNDRTAEKVKNLSRDHKGRAPSLS